MDKTKGRINMSDLIVRPRMLKSGKMVYELPELMAKEKERRNLVLEQSVKQKKPVK